MTQPDLKSFLLCDDVLVRDSVSFQFFESWSRDEELAPLTLEACRRFGEEVSLNLLSFACRFPLSARGLVDALQALAECHPPFVEQWVSLAPLDLVAARADLVRSVVSFRTTTRILRRASFQRTTAGELWRRLQTLCQRLDGRRAGPREWDEREDLIEALSSVERGETLAERTAGLRNEASPHLRGALVELTAAAGSHGRSTMLLDLLGSTDEGMARVAAKVLVRTKLPATVPEILDRYQKCSPRFRRFALRVLSSLQLPESERALHHLLELEEDPAHRGRIFDGLRFYFSTESAELLKRELEARTSSMIPKEIRKALYVSDRIRGIEDASGRAYRAELDARGDAEVYFQIPFFDPA
jgi:hypothetical protein